MCIRDSCRTPWAKEFGVFDVLCGFVYPVQMLGQAYWNRVTCKRAVGSSSSCDCKMEFGENGVAVVVSYPMTLLCCSSNQFIWFVVALSMDSLEWCGVFWDWLNELLSKGILTGSFLNVCTIYYGCPTWSFRIADLCSAVCDWSIVGPGTIVFPWELFGGMMIDWDCLRNWWWMVCFCWQ